MEAISQTTIITPFEYSKEVRKFCEERRGVMLSQVFLNNSKTVHYEFEIPFSELIQNFFDILKSISSGYASLDYEHKKFEISNIKKVIFLINGEPVDALTFLVHDSRAISFAKGYCKRLKELLPP